MRILRQFFKREIIICALLILVVFINWISLVRLLHETAAERAGFWFMQKHLSLGEPPQFVLGIAGQGLPQPLDVLLTWRDFQLGTLFAIVLIIGLIWLGLQWGRHGNKQ